MCGIIAIVSFTGPLDRDRCSRSLEALRRRGPDYEFSDFYESDRVFMGQTVLSITGNPGRHSDAYHRSVDRNLDLVFNGEIYNYGSLRARHLKDALLQTDTDTEVLVRLHEVMPYEQVPRELEGMYCYAVFDRRARSLWVARDLIGEKILYYRRTPEYVIFASEIQSILAFDDSVRVDVDSLREYFFTRHYLTQDRTCFDGIRVFQPGRFVRLDAVTGHIEVRGSRALDSLWDFRKYAEHATLELEGQVREADRVFRDVAYDMTPAQAAYSSVFSGGIDSALVAAYCADVREPLEFVNLWFSGKDELGSHRHRFEENLSSTIRSIPVSVDDFAQAFDHCFEVNCAPLATHSFVSQYLLSRAVRERGARVLLGGDGADELFGGYEYYRTFRDNPPSPTCETNPSPYSGFVPLGIEFEGWEPNLLREHLAHIWKQSQDLFVDVRDPCERTIQSILFCDSRVQLESVDIRSADVMNMINSVEGRSPFLHRKILDLALHMNVRHKIDLSDPTLFATKKCLKMLFARRFGEDVVFPKQGFSGYPNESGALLIGGDFRLFEEVLRPRRFDAGTRWTQALEWKMMNVEFFLRKFRSRLA